MERHLKVVKNKPMTRSTAETDLVLPENVRDMGEFYSVSFGMKTFVIGKNLSRDTLTLVFGYLVEADEAFESGDDEEFKRYLGLAATEVSGNKSETNDLEPNVLPTKTIVVGDVIFSVREDLSKVDRVLLENAFIHAQEAYSGGDRKKFGTLIQIAKIIQDGEDS